MNNKPVYIKKTNLIKTPKLSTKKDQKLSITFIPNKDIKNESIHNISKTPKKASECKENIVRNNLSKTPIKSNLIPEGKSKHKNEDIDDNSKRNSFYHKVRSIHYLSNIPTFDKVVKLQKLLKELSSIKGRFEENVNKFTDRINKKCYEYFKNKIFIKYILDYCEQSNPEEHKEYILIENTPKYLEKELYQIIFDFYFLTLY